MKDICKNWSDWLNKTRFSHLTDEQKAQTLNWLLAVRDLLLSSANIQNGQKIIDIGCGTGLLGFGVLEKFGGNVDVIFSDKFEDCIIECEKLLNSMAIEHKASFLLSDCADIKLENNSVDKALMRSVLVHVLDKQPAINEIYRILKAGGEFVAFEPIINSNTKYWELTSPDEITDYEDFKNAENNFMSDDNNPLTNFNQNTLAKNLELAGFTDGTVDVEGSNSSYLVDENTVENWVNSRPSPNEPSVRDRFLKYFDEKKVDNYILELKKALVGKNVDVQTNVVFIKAVK